MRILIISSLINDLDKNFIISNQDLKNASDYLICVENWGYDELGLLINIIDKLNINLACSIIQDLINMRKKFLTNDYRKTQLIKILLNISYSCIKHQYMDNANNFLKEAENLIATQRIENCIAEKYCWRFIKGFFYLISGETKTGIKLMKKAINNFKTTEDEEIIKRYEQSYIEALEQASYEE